MPEFKIKHVTKYTYESPVRESVNHITLYPIEDSFQKIVKHQLKISGNPLIDVFTDYYGNKIGFFAYSEQHSELEICSELTIVTTPKQPVVESIFSAAQWADLEQLRYKVPYIDYLKWEAFDGLTDLKKITDNYLNVGLSPYRVARDYCHYIFGNFAYIQGLTTVETQLSEIWKIKLGVCQDFAHILCQMLRMAKIPAKYVSGYICPNQNGVRGEGATHAWVEAFIPDYGWLGLDPTNDCIANETYVRLAYGRSFNDCSPAKGVYKGPSNHKLDVRVVVGYDNEPMDIGGLSFNETESTMGNSKPLEGNSYRRNLELLLQQQQQQQQ